MMSSLLLLIALGASYTGFACMAVAMPDHWSRAGGNPHRPATHARKFRRAGAALLCLALTLCILRDGAGFGVILWAVSMSASAIAVALTLTWHPRLLRYLVPKA